MIRGLPQLADVIQVPRAVTSKPRLQRVARGFFSFLEAGGGIFLRTPVARDELMISNDFHRFLVHVVLSTGVTSHN